MFYEYVLSPPPRCLESKSESKNEFFTLHALWNRVWLTHTTFTFAPGVWKDPCIIRQDNKPWHAPTSPRTCSTNKSEHGETRTERSNCMNEIPRWQGASGSSKLASQFDWVFIVNISINLYPTSHFRLGFIPHGSRKQTLFCKWHQERAHRWKLLHLQWHPEPVEGIVQFRARILSATNLKSSCSKCWSFCKFSPRSRVWFMIHHYLLKQAEDEHSVFKRFTVDTSCITMET